MTAYVDQKWGELREAIHTGDFKRAKYVLQTMSFYDDKSVLENMIQYYLAHRDRKGKGLYDELSMFALIKAGRLTHKEDLDLRLSTGILWSDSLNVTSQRFYHMMYDFKAQMTPQEWDEWCVGRDTLIVVPLLTSDVELRTLCIEACVWRGLVKQVKIYGSCGEDTLNDLREAFKRVPVTTEKL